MKGVRRLAVLPARGGSKRVPLKNIVDLLGKPAITYVLDAARAANVFDDIHVSTESMLIREVVEEAGNPPAFARPGALSRDETPILDVTRWVVAEYVRRGQEFDVVATIMPTAVLLRARHLVEALRLFEEAPAQGPVIAVVKATSPFEKALTMDETGRLSPVRPKDFGRRSQDGSSIYFDAGSFFLASPHQIRAADVTLSHLRGFRLPPHAAVDIDDSEDLELARHLLAGRRYLEGDGI